MLASRRRELLGSWIAALSCASAACHRSSSTQSPSHRPPPVPISAPVGTPAVEQDPSTLIVVHSWSGRTERIANELGAMLGARVVVFHDPPVPDAEHASPVLSDVRARVSLDGVHTLFLGFPVWGEAPAPPILSLIGNLSLAHVRVVPFYSFIHFLRPESLASLRTTLESRGATVLDALPFLAPLSATADELSQRAQRSLLARADLWADGADAMPVSCDARNAVDGSALCRVTAGIAWTGDGAEGAPAGARPPRRARVHAFDIDRAEITVAQYERCYAAGACPEINYRESFCQDLLAEGPNRDALPIPCATYEEAEAYCRWAGMRVPTDPEWSRAARGSTVHAFPWGDSFPTAPPVVGNFGEPPSRGFPGYSTVTEGATWPQDGFRGLAPPCSFVAGHSAFGVCDMAGNVAEWTANLGGADVTRGGSWLDGEANAFRVGSRAELPDTFSRRIGIYVTGIRCARDAN